MLEEDEKWVKENLVAVEKLCISRVLEVQTEEAVSKGDNYVSDIYRIKLKVVLHSGEIEKKSIIYKTIPRVQDESKLPGIKNLGIFNCEIRMYTEVLPAMERVLLEKDPFAEILWPRLIGFKKNYEGLLIEDCTPSGFKMEDRTKGYDFDSAVVALQGLARFHALAAVVIDRGEISVSDFDKWVFLKEGSNLSEVIEHMSKSYQKVIEEVWKGEWLEFGKGMEELPSTLKKRLRELGRKDETKFKTLNHGDYWLNNILFKRDSNGKANNIKIIDFQFCFYNNPCYDVNYLLSTCLWPELFDKKPDLLSIYYESLVKDLKVFEYREIPTFEQIQESYDRANVFGLYAGLTLRPFMTTSAVQAIRKEHPEVDIEYLTYLCLIYGGDYVQRSAKATLKYFKEIVLIK